MRSFLSRSSPATAYVLLTLTMLFWAGNYTIGRWAAGHVPPVTLAFLRWSGAALLILPLAWSRLKADRETILSHAPILLALGITGSGLFNTLQYIALTRTTATSAGVINSAAPVMIALMSFAMNGERVRAPQALGIGLSLAGVLTVISHADPRLLAGLAFNTGDLVMLVAMVVWAFYTALLMRRPRMDFLSFAAVTYLIAACLNSVLAAVEIAEGATVDWSLPTVAAIAYTAVFPSFLAYLFFNRGVEIVGPTRAGAFMHLVPLFTGLLAMVFLSEAPGLHHALGLVLILTGVWLAAGGRRL